MFNCLSVRLFYVFHIKLYLGSQQIEYSSHSFFHFASAFCVLKLNNLVDIPGILISADKESVEVFCKVDEV